MPSVAIRSVSFLDQIGRRFGDFVPGFGERLDADANDTVFLRSGRATLSARAWPRVGKRFDLDVAGPASRPFAVFLSLRTATFEVPPFGWVSLGTPLFLVGAGTLNASGSGHVAIPVPPIRSLAGLEVFHQAVAGQYLTNLVRVNIFR